MCSINSLNSVTLSRLTLQPWKPSVKTHISCCEHSHNRYGTKKLNANKTRRLDGFQYHWFSQSLNRQSRKLFCKLNPSICCLILLFNRFAQSSFSVLDQSLQFLRHPLGHLAAVFSFSFFVFKYKRKTSVYFNVAAKKLD